MAQEKDESDKLNYAVVNSEEITTSEKLEKYTGEIQWSYLKPHFDAGSLIWVSKELSLTEVGKAITDDESSQVASWKQEGHLVIPSDPHAEYWESIDAGFCALVVSPFVLIQPLEEE
ncbi:MAG: DUF2288 domain-containing protein [Verrucomicrobiales bacterium]|nr:DUF2288 domain-containing protein [Verrucomicrobiales bacterium]